MGFVQAGFLAALAAIAVPVVMHLVFARPRRRVDLGTLRFLQVSMSESARRKWLKRYLLLAFRIGAVVLLAVLFARPFLLALHQQSDDRLVVVLIDQSGSMSLEGSAGSSFDLALGKAKRLLSGYGSGTEVRLAFFDHAVHPAEGGSFDALISSEHAARSPGHSITDYGAAVAWARDVCTQSRRAHKELHLFTDLQLCGLGVTPSQPFPADVRVAVIDCGQPYPRNAAVTRASPSQLVVRPQEPIAVDATVLNASQFALDKVPVVLHLRHDQRQRNWRSHVTLSPGQSDTVEFKLPQMGEGLWQGYVVVETDDELPMDNRRYLAISVTPPMDVLSVDGDPSESIANSETYFLNTALRLAPPDELHAESPFLPRSVSLFDGGRLPDIRPASAVVLANVSQLLPDDIDRLASYVRQGGGLLIFGGEQCDGKLCQQLAGVGMQLGELISTRSSAGLPWRLENWDVAHPVFRPFFDPQYGDLRRMAFRAFNEVSPSDGNTVLAKFQDGAPALLECQYGQGKVLWFTSSCDRDWSDWPRSRLYVPLVHQFVSYLVGLSEGGPIRSREINQVELSEEPLVSGVLAPGVYDRGSHHEIVNSAPIESETDRATIQDLADHLQFEVVGEEGKAEAQVLAAGFAGNEMRQDEVWYWALLVLLAVLFVECILANRTAG